MKNYKIPIGFDQSHLDMEIKIVNSPQAKPISVKFILFGLASVLSLFVVMSDSLVQYGTIGQKVIFGIMWFIMTGLLISIDSTKRMGFQLIPVAVSYMSKNNRRLVTRKSSNANEFLKLARVTDINDEGVISFSDGTYGLVYSVVGSASALLFSNDIDSIVNRVDSFYRKISPDCEIQYTTLKESQNMEVQLESLARKRNKLRSKDPDLQGLLDEQKHILSNHVGGSYKSLRQYMLAKGDNMEALMQIRSTITMETNASALMLRQALQLEKDEIVDLFGLYFKG